MDPGERPIDRPAVHAFRLEDAEAVAPPGGGWEGGLRQLDRGRLGYRGRKVFLPGAYVWWHAYEGRVLARWQYDGDAVCLLVPLEGDGPMKYQGRALDTGGVVWLHAGPEHECVTPRGIRGVEVGLSAEVVAGWGRGIEPRGAQRLDRRHLARLVDTCRRITQVVTHARDRLGWRHGVALRERLADVVRRALRASAPGTDGTRSHRVVRAAAARMLDRPLASEVDVSALAADLGVAERTLYQAFREWLGVPPYEYQRIERLHAFRRALHVLPAGRGRVRDAARAAGLPEGGRLAQIYRRHFAETPRETLRRWAREGSAYESWPAVETAHEGSRSRTTIRR